MVATRSRVGPTRSRARAGAGGERDYVPLAWRAEALEGCRGIAWLLYAMIRHRAADTWWLLVRGRGWERRGGRALRAASEMMINDVPPWPGEALEGCRGMAELGCCPRHIF